MPTVFENRNRIHNQTYSMKSGFNQKVKLEHMLTLIDEFKSDPERIMKSV